MVSCTSKPNKGYAVSRDTKLLGLQYTRYTATQHGAGATVYKKHLQAIIPYRKTQALGLLLVYRNTTEATVSCNTTHCWGYCIPQYSSSSTAETTAHHRQYHNTTQCWGYCTSPDSDYCPNNRAPQGTPQHHTQLCIPQYTAGAATPGEESVS